MKVKELIAELQKMPEDAETRIILGITKYRLDEIMLDKNIVYLGYVRDGDVIPFDDIINASNDADEAYSELWKAVKSYYGYWYEDDNGWHVRFRGYYAKYYSKNGTVVEVTKKNTSNTQDTYNSYFITNIDDLKKFFVEFLEAYNAANDRGTISGPSHYFYDEDGDYYDEDEDYDDEE